ncbi:MAG: hypothetical protein R3D58_14490 [Saprospiraceae bacterium]
MNKQECRSICMILCILTGLLYFQACQNDQAPVNAGTEANSAAKNATEETATAATAPDYATQANTLNQQIEQYHTKLGNLIVAVSVIPEAAKKNAVDYAELDGRLGGMLERGNSFREEIEAVQDALAGKSEKIAAHDGGVDVGGKLYELQSGVAELNEALTGLEQAVEKLKRAGGKKIVLFEGQ